MPVVLASGLLRLLTGYLLVGVVALPWLYRRAWPAAAPGARGASLGFIALALPGTLLLWPALLWRARHQAIPSGQDITPLRRWQLIGALLAGTIVIAAVITARVTRRPPPAVESLPALDGPAR